jgi:hypothetical protein
MPPHSPVNSVPQTGSSLLGQNEFQHILVNRGYAIFDEQVIAVGEEELGSASRFYPFDALTTDDENNGAIEKAARRSSVISAVQASELLAVTRSMVHRIYPGALAKTAVVRGAIRACRSLVASMNRNLRQTSSHKCSSRYGQRE